MNVPSFHVDDDQFRQLLDQVRKCNIRGARTIMERLEMESHQAILLNASIPGEDTPLIVASKRSFTPMVEYLLSLGADPNKRNSANESPLFVACNLGYYESVELLLEYGAQLPFAENGKLPFQYFFNERIINLLIEMGMSLEINIPCDMETITTSYLEIWNEVTYPASQLRYQHMPSGSIRGLNLLLNHGATVSFYRSWKNYDYAREDTSRMNEIDFYLQDLLHFACRHGLVHVAVLCLARDNGDRIKRIENSPDVRNMKENIFSFMLLDTFHPTIILLLLGYPIYDTVDLLGRFFREDLPRSYFRPYCHNAFETNSGDECQFRRKKRLQEYALTEWSDSIVFEILRNLAPSTLSMDLHALDDDGNNLLLRLIQMRPGFKFAPTITYPSTFDSIDFPRYVQKRDLQRRAQRYYLFSVHLLLQLGVDVCHVNLKGETILDLLGKTSLHPSNYRETDYQNYMVNTDNQRDLILSNLTAPVDIPGTGNGPLTASREDKELFRKLFVRWCMDLLHSVETPTCLQPTPSATNSTTTSEDAAAMKFPVENWCSAFWPLLLCSSLAPVPEMAAKITNDDFPSSQLIDQCLTPELSLLLLECILFHFLHYCIHKRNNIGNDQLGAKGRVFSSLWVRLRRQWWLWTHSL